MRLSTIEHEFVDEIPSELEEGRLYVSLRYRTASHLCACGCGTRIVTPIKPPKWHLYFDGDTVSLTPSVGSWQQPCRSHYWIKKSQVVWAKPWTDKEIATGRRNDSADVRRYYADRQAEVETMQPERPANLLEQIKRKLRRK